MPPGPGEIYWAYLEEMTPRRLVVVVSREELNRGDYVVVVSITSAKLETRWMLPNCVPLRRGRYGLHKDCVAQAEAIAQIPQSCLDWDTGVIGTLDATGMRDLIRAIGYVVAAHYEPT